jgi:hypothetical protein
MTKNGPLESVRLMTAAVNARDALRSKFIPLLDAALHQAEKPEQTEALNRLRDLAHYHADSLRFALKSR